ncbi:MAG: hypothetical protein U0903_04090 [Planctomycetales bacterium]
MIRFAAVAPAAWACLLVAGLSDLCPAQVGLAQVNSSAGAGNTYYVELGVVVVFAGLAIFAVCRGTRRQ